MRYQADCVQQVIHNKIQLQRYTRKSELTYAVPLRTETVEKVFNTKSTFFPEKPIFLVISAKHARFI
jgi:hypothetical protein